MGLLSAQEHRGEMRIHDGDVVKSDAMENQESWRVSGDLRVIWEAHWGLLSVQEHGEETLIYDVEVVECDPVKKSKNTERIW